MKIKFDHATLRVTHTPKARRTVLTLRDAQGNALASYDGTEAVRMANEPWMAEKITRTDVYEK